METLVENEEDRAAYDAAAFTGRETLAVPEWLGLAYSYDEDDNYVKLPGGNIPEFAEARKTGQAINVLGEAHEDESYSFDESYVVETGGRYYLVHTSGCSCPTPEEQACLTAGPAATLGGLFDELHVNSENGKKYVPNTAKRAFVDAIDRMNQQTLLATKKALGLV